jgi:uncharacterized membrane protein YdcZ (DUF606 family)
MSNKLDSDSDTPVQPAGFSPVEFSVVSRRIIIYQINDAELETIAASGSSLHLTLFGVCCGALISLLVTVTTVSLPNPATFAAYISATIIMALATLFFGWRGLEAYLAGRKKLAEIRQGNPTALRQ